MPEASEHPQRPTIKLDSLPNETPALKKKKFSTLHILDTASPNAKLQLKD